MNDDEKGVVREIPINWKGDSFPDGEKRSVGKVVFDRPVYLLPGDSIIIHTVITCQPDGTMEVYNYD